MRVSEVIRRYLPFPRFRTVFFKLNLVNIKTGKPNRDHEALKISIRVGIVCTAILNYTLEYPQGLAYEKVYWPFIIISKKRYVGNFVKVVRILAGKY